MTTKKEKQLKTLIGVVLDETGSMSSIQGETISAFNEWRKTVEETDPTAKVTMVQFSDMFGQELSVREVCKGRSIKSVKPLTGQTYRPRGNTPLYDAVGSVIRLLEAAEKGYDRVLVMIQTDGLENASRDFSREEVKQLVKEKEASGTWTFAFVGLGFDAWAQGGARLGMASVGSTMSSPATVQGVGAMSEANVGSTRSYLSSNVTAVPDFYKVPKEKRPKKEGQ